MTRKGVTVVQTPVAMVDDFTKQSQDVWTDLAGKIYSKDELDMVHQVPRRVPREAQEVGLRLPS